MKKVIVFSPISENLYEQLKKQYQVNYINLKENKNKTKFIQEIEDADALIGASVVLNGTNLKKAKKLKVISSISAGYDNYDLEYLKENKIALTHTPHVLTETTADLAFTLLMSTARRVPELNAWTKAGNWKEAISSDYFGQEIYGKTLGIIGLGNIGSAIARRGFHGFNMNILYHNRTPKPEVAAPLSAQYCSLNELLEQSDFVVLAINLNNQSHALIGTKEFQRMQSHAILINTARGAVVDEKALIHALETKQIFAAGLDVYEKEPLSESKLLRLDNVVTVPHIGSATHRTRQNMEALAYRNLNLILDEKQCVNLVQFN